MGGAHRPKLRIREQRDDAVAAVYPARLRMGVPGRLLIRLAVLAIGLGLVLAAAAGPAWAHATVVRSSPKNGANVSRTPASVSITFDEPVGLQPGYVQVIDSNGARVDVGAPTHPGGDGRTVSVALRPQRPGPAGYLASYRVISADSHPVSGVVRFTVDGGSAVSTAPTTPSTSTTVSVLLDVATGLTYLGLVLAGGAWVLLSRAGIIADHRAHSTVRVGLLIAAVAIAAQFLIQGPYAAGSGITHLLDGTLLHDTVATGYGGWHLVTLASLLVLLAATVPAARWTTRLTSTHEAVLAGFGGVWVVALLGVAESGHAGVDKPVWLGLLSTVVHLLAMSTWAGGLVLLMILVLPATSPAPPPIALRRFSAVALSCVLAIGVTGGYQAWREIRTLTALVSTTYGLLVLVKVALYVVLVGLGSIARRHVRRDDSPRALRRGVGVEIAVLAAVLAVTSVLVTEPPASRAYANRSADRAVTVTVTFDTIRSATIEIDPAHTGAVDVTISLTGVRSIENLTVTAALPSQHLGPLPVPLHVGTTPAEFTAHDLDLPLPGAWQFELTLRTSEFDSTVADATVAIQAGT